VPNLASLSRSTPPPIPVRERHPLDVDPLDFARRRQVALARSSPFPAPPAALAKHHRPAALAVAFHEVCERLRRPIIEIDGRPGRTVEFRGLFRFQFLRDGTVIASTSWHGDRSTWRKEHHDPETLPLKPLADTSDWTLAALDLFSSVLQTEVQATVNSGYLMWAFRRLQMRLVDEGLWRDPEADIAPQLGFDPRLLAIAQRIPTREGLRASLAAYNLVARHPDEFLRLEHDHPALARLYATFRSDPSFPADGEPIARLRHFLAASGISGALWRRIAGTEGGERYLPETWAGIDHAGCALHALMIADALGPQHEPPRWLIEAVLAQAGNMRLGVETTLRMVRPALRRIAALHARAGEDERARMREWMPPVMGWLAEALPGDERAIRRASWAWFERKALDGEHADSMRLVRWRVPFERMEFDGHDVVAIADSYALRDEGSVMRHCVLTYASRCFHGAWLVCSIRSRADPHARWTAGYVREDGRWRLAEVKGHANAGAPGAIVEIARLVQEHLAETPPDRE